MNRKSNRSLGPIRSRKAAGRLNGILLFVLVLLFCAACVVTSCFRFSDDKPNIILISIDTLRHDHVGYSGHRPEGKSPSPFIDSLAEKGTVFTHAVSTSSWTLPGHYSMITGLPDELHEMYDDRMPFNPKIQTMAENLKKQGYATGGFYSGPYLHSFFGFDQGFDMYESCMKQDTMYDVMAYKGNQLDQEEIKNLNAEKELKSHLDITSKAVIDKALFFARSHRDERMFLFLHFFDVHNDYIPPAPFNKQFDADYAGWINGFGIMRDPRINKKMKARHLNHVKALYNGEIAWVDHNISSFFDSLNKLNPGILDNSIVIITSDHGEEFFEHGYIGHRWNLHGESIRIPLIFWAPGRVAEGVRIDDPIRIYDIYPTLQELAGIPVADQIYGRSVVPLMLGSTMNPEPILSELTFIPAEQEADEVYHKHYACQFKDLKMIRIEKRKWSKQKPLDFTGDVVEEQMVLFNVKDDPLETNNLAETDPKLAEQVLASYHREVARQRACYTKVHGKREAKDAKKLSPELQKMIEETGYAGGRKNQNR